MLKKLAEWMIRMQNSNRKILSTSATEFQENCEVGHMLTLRLCKKYIGYLLKTADGFPLLPEIKAKGRGIHEEAVSSTENKKTAIHLRKLDNRFPKGIFGADDETRTRDLILTKAVLEGMKYDFLVFLRYW